MISTSMNIYLKIAFPIKIELQWSYKMDLQCSINQLCLWKMELCIILAIEKYEEKYTEKK